MDARWIWLAVALAAGCEREEVAPARPELAEPAQLPAPPRAVRIIGHAGPNELFPDEGWMPLAGSSRAVFEAANRAPAANMPSVRETVLPADLPPDALFGSMWTGGAERAAWILTGDARRGYVFRFDDNLDGDLTNDPVRTLAKGSDGNWTCDVDTVVPDPGLAVLRPLRFAVTIHEGEIAIALSTRRTGQLEVGGAHVRFVVEGIMGRYGADKQGIAFDLDGDGTADIDPRGEEAFLVRDRRVVLGGASYDFAVASDGATVTLTPTPPGTAGAGRPSLKVGAAAPPFTATDLAGAKVDLASLRGKVVVLDFWARWCHPCVESLPDLIALEKKDRTAGLAMVSVVIEDEPAALRTFVAEHELTWPQIPEPGEGPIQQAYRIVSVPELYVIGRDGTLACSRCGGDELAAAVDAALRK